jgi:hypothetical protein
MLIRRGIRRPGCMHRKDTRGASIRRSACPRTTSGACSSRFSSTQCRSLAGEWLRPWLLLSARPQRLAVHCRRQALRQEARNRSLPASRRHSTAPHRQRDRGTARQTDRHGSCRPAPQARRVGAHSGGGRAGSRRGGETGQSRPLAVRTRVPVREPRAVRVRAQRTGQPTARQPSDACTENREQLFRSAASKLLPRPHAHLHQHSTRHAKGRRAQPAFSRFRARTAYCARYACSPAPSPHLSALLARPFASTPVPSSTRLRPPTHTSRETSVRW